jgi:predicted acyltransferase
MSIGTTLTPSRRLESLDVLRGLTIAGMLLVNNPGTWDHIYWPLEHAEWNGWTLTDLVFPFFLFMVGMAMMYSFPKRLERGDSKRDLMLHVVRRAFALMLLGWWGSTWSRLLWPGDAFHEASGVGTALAVVLRLGFAAAVLAAVVLLAGTRRPRAWWIALGVGLVLAVGGLAALGFDDSLARAIAGIRIPGVLVRIGVCYLLASAIYFATPDPRAIAWWIVGLLGAYALWMLLVPVPLFGMPDLDRGFPTADTPVGELFSNWCFYIDYHVLGTHTWSFRQLYDGAGRLVWSFDPEGVLSTVGAVGSVLLGVRAGMWMRRTDLDEPAKLNGLFVGASWLMGLGLVMSIWLPINKNLWSSSYTVFSAGMALLCLAVLYHAVDLKGWRTWAVPLRAYGRNAIFAFVASGMMTTALGRITVGAFEGEGTTSAKVWTYDLLLAATGDAKFASFVFAVAFVSIWAVVAWWLDRRKIYFKV